MKVNYIYLELTIHKNCLKTICEINIVLEINRNIPNINLMKFAKVFVNKIIFTLHNLKLLLMYNEDNKTPVKKKKRKKGRELL